MGAMHGRYMLFDYQSSGENETMRHNKSIKDSKLSAVKEVKFFPPNSKEWRKSKVKRMLTFEPRSINNNSLLFNYHYTPIENKDSRPPPQENSCSWYKPWTWCN